MVLSATTNSVSLDFLATATSGTLSVTATNMCGVSVPRTLAITVNPLAAQPGAFTVSSAIVCRSQNNVIYTVPNDPTVTYTWSYDGTGATIAGSGNSVSVNFSGTATSGNISVTATNGCGTSAARTLAITVNTVPNRPAAFTAFQTPVCQGTSGVVYTVPAVAGATSYLWTYVTGSGVTFNGTSNSVTADFSAIATSGTISVVAQNSCGNSIARTQGVIVNTLPTASSPSSTPTICVGTALTNITHTTTGATGIGAATGLPAGVNAAWASNTITISGTPTATGTFNYTITLTGGCGAGTANGTITVTTGNTITLSSAAGTDNQTSCINAPITNITYTTTVATGATFSGLPAGVTGSWASNVVTISGTPTASGPFNYTVTLTGGCGAGSANGTINVTAANTITLSSAAGTNSQTVCINAPITNITYATTGATGATFSGLPAGVTGGFAANTVTISGTPTASGPFSYTVYSDRWVRCRLC